MKIYIEGGRLLFSMIFVAVGKMHIILCIDDTDSIDSIGTGELATLIAEAIEEKGFGKSSYITRHQLFIHPDIPYTSHNSSMCFEAEIEDSYLEQVINYAADFLKVESAEGSDPGLCIAVKDRISKPELLVEFGKKAKKEIITIAEAYDLAKKLGVHLSEHGGTGQGVIGALAGVGLRMSGNDGRLKGKIKLASEKETENVGHIKKVTGFESVKDLNGYELKDREFVNISKELKAVFLDGKSTLLVFSKADENGNLIWEPCTKQQLKVY